MLAIFLDLETTGLDFRKHSVVELACKIVDISTGNTLAAYQSIVKQPFDKWENRDLASIAVNGFTWEMLADGKEEALISSEIIQLFTDLDIQRGKAVFICQNPAFDKGFFTQLVNVYTQEQLNWPYHWLDFASMYWALLTQQARKLGEPFPSQLNLSKNEIAKRYQLPPEQHPHRAMNGVDHLILCYSTVVGMGEEE